MTDTEKDRSILRTLAERQAQIAALPIQKTNAQMWQRMNSLRRGKPMVWITEVPWPEMGPGLELQTTDPFCQEVERQLRRTLYQWEHYPADMVVDDKFYCPIVIRNSGFGIKTKEKTILQGGQGSISAHQYEPVIHDEKDVEKIQTPQITADSEATQRNYDRLVALFGDILPIEKTCRRNWSFSPWDYLITLWGVQEALTDLVERPDLVHLGIDRLVSAYLGMLDQYEEQGLLSLNNENLRIGSGGLGYTDQLPGKDFNPGRVRTKNLWGAATAQIFSDVSPRMHWEFALQYEVRLLERFGLNYYGCCEPLHHKMDILKRIPNLRRVSMSPKVPVEKGAAALADRYVYSMKPNPAILAVEKWNIDAARAELKANLEKTRGCVVEVILKDISTVRNEPRRVWEWAKMAAEVTAEFA